MTGHRAPGRRLALFLGAGVLVALFLAGVVSILASDKPDGLDAATRAGCTFNAADEITGGDCVARRSGGHPLADSPLAGYGVQGVRNPSLATGLSGVAGVLIVLAVGGALFWAIRRRGPISDPGREATSDPGREATSDPGRDSS